MALVKYGGGIIQASGSIAGNVFARNRAGNYMRARTKPVNPNSSRQTAARIAIAFLAEQWRDSPMTDAKRAAWETYAAAINWQNALGEVIKLTGFQHFMRSNARLIRCSLPIVTDGPTVLSLPGADTDFAVAFNATTQKITVTYDDTAEWADEDGGALQVHMGRPQNPTRNFFGGPYRFADSIDGDSVSPPTSTVDIDPSFLIVAGQKVWARASLIRLDGRCSDFFSASPVVAT